MCLKDDRCRGRCRGAADGTHAFTSSPLAYLVPTSHVKILSVQTLAQQIVIYVCRRAACCARLIGAQALSGRRNSFRDGFPHGGGWLLLGGRLSRVSVKGLPELCHKVFQVLVACRWICTGSALYSICCVQEPSSR